MKEQAPGSSHRVKTALSMVVLALTLTLTSTVLLAQTITKEEIVRRLAAEGYGRIRISRTFLGRTKIVAEAPDRKREIVIDPGSGEILRDYVRRNSDPKESGLFGWMFGDDQAEDGSGNDDHESSAEQGMEGDDPGNGKDAGDHGSGSDAGGYGKSDHGDDSPEDGSPAHEDPDNGHGSDQGNGHGNDDG